MTDVGIRELKQRLSEYLDRAERGEVLRVTDRGRPKAVLGPVPGRARIEGGIRAGWIKRGTGLPLGLAHRSKASRRVLDVLGRGSRGVSTYVDTSALLKRYVEEADSADADALLRADRALLTARHTIVEVRRNLARLLGRDLVAARSAFAEDLRSFSIIELDEVTCEHAASITEATGVRTLDALHLAAAQRVSEPGVGFLTFELRQAQAARALGLTVVTA